METDSLKHWAPEIQRLLAQFTLKICDPKTNKILSYGYHAEMCHQFILKVILTFHLISQLWYNHLSFQTSKPPPKSLTGWLFQVHAEAGCPSTPAQPLLYNRIRYCHIWHPFFLFLYSHARMEKLPELVHTYSYTGKSTDFRLGRSEFNPTLSLALPL